MTNKLDDRPDLLAVLEHFAHRTVRTVRGPLQGFPVRSRQHIFFLEDSPAGLGHFVDAIMLHDPAASTPMTEHV